ncbi:hypothetical protein K443DRAFT_13986 [Laccaria amethystina LaAM-08-1]|uniref:Reverse transcriptase domain-containing protein n=1 Tax=Laccaria amethystina LaAM-08-1 TaxID=1095629 RepID=A0A0C9WU56_9AGAR|nr:hypothetical protein K443DRAFT_13986 [Laccaria amethystina LaAM-08-1]
MGQVDNGIPQGSPISPILTAFYTSGLLEQFQPKSLNPANQEFPSPDNVMDVHLLMYVDDGKLYVSSKSLKTNVAYLKGVYNKAKKWLKDAEGKMMGARQSHSMTRMGYTA